MRIAECADGKILIDDLDISTLNIKLLRSKIAVMPQEPVMLMGTIRSNLDPYNAASDEEIWKALKAVHIGDKIKDMTLQLETPVTGNFFAQPII